MIVLLNFNSLKYPIVLSYAIFLVKMCGNPQNLRYNWTVISFRRPTGSEHNVPTAGVLDIDHKSAQPDHIGGYQAAIPILEGIETKFGLCLPKFRVATVQPWYKWYSLKSILDEKK